MTISTNALAEALRIRKAIDQIDLETERLEAALAEVLGGGPARRGPGRPAKRTRRAKPKVGRKAAKPVGRPPKSEKKAAPAKKPKKATRRELVHDILKASAKPMNTAQILDQLVAKGHPLKGGNPKKTLGVLLYTDKAIKRSGRGMFTAG